jgi:dipeptidyl-peptidase-4
MKMMKRLSFLVLMFSLAMQSVVAQDSVSEKEKKITLADLWRNYTFQSKSVRGLRSMDDGKHYTTLEQSQFVVKYRYKDGNAVDTLVHLKKAGHEDLKQMQGYAFNSDETKVLIYTNRKDIYRRSFTADYFVMDLASGEISALSENGRQQLATFAPDGDKVAFVRENNIFIKMLNSGEELAVTTDGEPNKIINGAPDWVYEEEFEFNKAFEWSPDGKKIAFIRFDEREVKEYHMTIYAGQKPHLQENDPYPEARKWKYPKAGEDNSVVSVHVYHLDSEETIEVDTGEETDQYIPRIRWTQDPEVLSVFRLNRHQNFFEILLADADKGSAEVMYEEKNEYFIDETNFDYISFLDDNRHFTLVSEIDGWNQLFLMDMEGEVKQKLTTGSYDMTDYYGYDPDSKRFYFQAAKESPLRREVYSVNMNGKKLHKLTDKPGTSSASFSNGFKYYISNHSSATTPPVTSLHNIKGKEIRVLEDNAQLKDKMDEYNNNLKEFFSFKTSQDVELNGYMIKPLDFDESKEYPVLMTQYSGPNSQSVTDSWSFGWHNYLAQEGYMVVCADGRGTGARGEEFRKMTYLQLGKYETIDQIETAKYLSEKAYVDEENIAIWGWSYGGFMTCLALAKGEGIFDAGIAVAPVTNWRYYDNIYTERFMRTPQENKEGYEDNSPLNFADQLQGNLLLVHGSADDNVHLQNTMEFAERLVQADKQFDMQIYTNRNHGIYGGNTRYHLYNMMTRFLEEHLKD